MRRSRPTAGALLAAALGCGAILGGHAANAGGSLADVDAAARATGNRKAEAIRIGQALFTTLWPVQIRKVRVDGTGRHLVAGLVLSGVKFHGKLSAEGLTNEVIALVDRTFAADPVEEVDVWTIVPLPTYVHEVVSGDLAQPTSRIVYGATILRSELPTFAARLRRGDDVYWQPGWRQSLAKE